MMQPWAQPIVAPYEGHKDVVAIFSYSGNVADFRRRTANFNNLPRVEPGGIMIMPQDFRDWMFCTHPRRLCRVVHEHDGDGGTNKVIVCQCGESF